MKYLLIIGIILILFGCTPLSKVGIENYDIVHIEKSDFSVLNGIYENQHDTVVGKLKHSPGNGLDELERLSILNQLFLSVPELSWRDSLGTIIEPDEKFILIEFIDSKKAYVSFYHNHDLIFTKKIRGKFKNGYFYLRPKGFIIPLIPLIFGYNFQRTRIGKSGDYLLIDYTVNRWGFALVAGSSDKGYASSRYKVIKRK
jgi:hypothetical protein